MIDPKFARRGLFLVFVILFLDVMGIAIIMPVHADLPGRTDGRYDQRGGRRRRLAAACLCRHAVRVLRR